QRRDLALVHGVDQLAELEGVVGGAGGGGLHVADGAAHVAERLVDGVRQRVHHGRLLLAGDHDAAAAGGLQVVEHGLEDARVDRLRAGGDRAGAELRRQRRRGGGDVGRLERHAVVGERTGGAGGGLQLAEAVHVVLSRSRTAPVGTSARVGEAAGAAVEEVGAQRHHHVGLAEVVDGG